MRKRVQDGIHSINGTGVGILGKQQWVVCLSGQCMVRRANKSLRKTVSLCVNKEVSWLVGGGEF